MYKGLYKVEIGKETTLGTAVACTSMLDVEAMYPTDETERAMHMSAVGIAGFFRGYVSNRLGVLTLPDTPLTFEQFPWYGNMGLKGVTGAADGAGTGKVYTYPFVTSGTAPAPYSYTLRATDEQQCYQFTGGFMESMTIKGEYGGPIMLAGAIRVRPEGKGTATGVSVPTGLEQMHFGNASLFIDTEAGGFGATEISDTYDTFNSFELTINKYFIVRPTGNGSGVYYSAVKWSTDYEIILKYTLEHDAASVAEYDAWRAGTMRCARIDITGATLGTGATYTTKLLRIDVAGEYLAQPEWSDKDGDILMTHTLTSRYGATVTTRGQIICVNESAAPV